MENLKWAEDETTMNEMKEYIEKGNMSLNFNVKTQQRVNSYSSFFAEWEERNAGDLKTILIRLFPRDGMKDKWTDGYYLAQCKNCNTVLPQDIAVNRKPCPRCSYAGLVYIPGRTENKPILLFPRNIIMLIKEAADQVWDGDIAVDVVKEINAIAIQFQDTNLTNEAKNKLLNGFFNELNRGLINLKKGV